MTELDIKGAVKYVELSVEVYGDNGGRPIQWEFVADSDAVLGLTDSGYYGALYKRVGVNELGVEKTEYAISHRGTDGWSDLTGPNLSLGLGNLDTQNIESYDFTLKLKDIYDLKLEETAQIGHSLGGALAKLVGRQLVPKTFGQ